MIIRWTIVLFICLAACMQSCAFLGIFPRDRLHLKKRDQRMEISQTGLKINGVYLGQNTDGSNAFFLLYNDGLCFMLRRTMLSLDTLLHSNLIEDQVHFSSKSSPIGWGLYELKQHTIDIEYWWVVQASIEYNRVKWRGEIQNDTTIAIYDGWGICDTTVFKFYPMDNKPDSTNRFIK